jgi:hypothetical protein
MHIGSSKQRKYTVMPKMKECGEYHRPNQVVEGLCNGNMSTLNPIYLQILLGLDLHLYDVVLDVLVEPKVRRRDCDLGE